MNEIKIKAMAKINLGLDVTGKRQDGYHEVRMIMQTVELYDKLKFTKTEQGISIRTNKKELPVDENNLIYKAIKLMQEEYHISGGISVRLEKNIPVAAGLAGGSTDAAAALTAMNRLYDLNLDAVTLRNLSVRIGADVPYCLMGGTALAEGIGEILTPLPAAPACYVLIAKPDIEVSTKSVYEKLSVEGLQSHPDIDSMIQAIWKKNLNGVAECMENVLETVTVSQYPVIEKLKDMMRHEGALEAVMSGSGPTVFGLFPDALSAGKAYKEIAASNLAETYVAGFADKNCVIEYEG